MTKMLFDSKYIIFLLCTLLFPSVYNEGDTVSLMHQNQSFQVCSGEYYTESVSLADFNGDLNGGHNTVILIDMSASW